MDMLNVLDLVEVNEERTAEVKKLSDEKVKQARALAYGQALLAGKSTEIAEQEGEAAAQKEVSEYTYFELDSDVVYPAAIAWLRENGTELLRLSSQPDSELVTLALDGNKVAHFVLRCKQYAPNNLPISDEAWGWALLGKSEMNPEDQNAIEQRAKALDAARLFVTEALHQSVQKAISLHWSKSDLGKH